MFMSLSLLVRRIDWINLRLCDGDLALRLTEGLKSDVVDNLRLDSHGMRRSAK